MQYQVFVQNPSEQKFLVSVMGISNLTAEGITEEEAISNVKSVLES
jgi:predicted RNase H-like HicB family nuclease